MPTPTTSSDSSSTTEADLEALGDYLVSDRAPPECMGLSDLDGFLTGLVVGPKLLEPAAWLPTVWGDDDSALASSAEAKAMQQIILSRYEEIRTTLRDSPEDHSPILIEDGEGEIFYDDWAAGFLGAVSLQPEAWAPLFEDDDAVSLLLPLVVAGGEDGGEGVGLAPEAEETLRREMPDYLPLAILGIQGFWEKIRRH